MGESDLGSLEIGRPVDWAKWQRDDGECVLRCNLILFPHEKMLVQKASDVGAV